MVHLFQQIGHQLGTVESSLLMVNRISCVHVRALVPRVRFGHPFLCRPAYFSHPCRIRCLFRGLHSFINRHRASPEFIRNCITDGGESISTGPAAELDFLGFNGFGNICKVNMIVRWRP